MPTSAEILASASRIANEAFPVAVAWHVAIAAALLALASGWRPVVQVWQPLLALPVATASVLALGFGNPFNAALLGLLALALFISPARLEPRDDEETPSWAPPAGLLVVIFACVYPHFLVGKPPETYLWGAPVGLIPCPTVALALGFALLGGGMRANAASVALALAGTFYSLVGIFKLGVALDVGLLVATVAFCALELPHARGHRELPTRPRHRHG